MIISSKKNPEIPTDDPVGKLKVFKDGAWTYIDIQDKFNSKGVYRRFIEIDETENKTYILSFLGAISCVELYVNGEYVGYSEGAHNTAEFDITNFLKKGANEIVVLVYKWTTGTYLECQDMFRHNGIFRDVLLYKNDKDFLYDFSVVSKKTNNGYNLDIKLDFRGDNEKIVSLELLKDGISVAKGKCTAKSNYANYLFEDLKVEEWNAEMPVLYDLCIEVVLPNGKVLDTVVEKVGFRNITIDGNVFKLNGRAIKMKGVNHHDSHPKTGYYLSPNDILKDIQLMKAFNVNTVRTSHYPPDPLFLESLFL